MYPIIVLFEFVRISLVFCVIENCNSVRKRENDYNRKPKRTKQVYLLFILNIYNEKERQVIVEK